MSPKQKAKLFAIKCRSKRGKNVTRAESRFCQRMFEQFPDEYGKDEIQVFKATTPIGARGWLEPEQGEAK